MRANIIESGFRMTPIRNRLSGGFTISLANQISNGTHPVRPKISAEICRGAEV